MLLTFCFRLLQLSQAWAVRCRCSAERPGQYSFSNCTEDAQTNQAVLLGASWCAAMVITRPSREPLMLERCFGWMK
jgi:hypothetical protein